MICAEIVKAPVLYAKYAAQHYADLQMLNISVPFCNPVTQKRKEIECARVDGSFGVGRSHFEEHYWWTIRHLNVGSRMKLVTSRNSGARYRNRVELLNGCLALGHANLNGSEKVDYDLLRDNLNAAIVYISRVDKTSL